MSATITLPAATVTLPAPAVMLSTTLPLSAATRALTGLATAGSGSVYRLGRRHPLNLKQRREFAGLRR